jgi:hypothetical protein
MGQLAQILIATVGRPVVNENNLVPARRFLEPVKTLEQFP